MNIYELKGVIIGKDGVGKQTLMKTLGNSDSTIDFSDKTGDYRLKLELYKEQDPKFACFIFVYDITNMESWEYLENNYFGQFLDGIQRNLQFMILLGCKSDLDQKEVNSQTVEKVASSNQMLFLEISSLNRKNIDFLLKALKIRSTQYAKKLQSLSRASIYHSINSFNSFNSSSNSESQELRAKPTAQTALKANQKIVTQTIVQQYEEEEENEEEDNDEDQSQLTEEEEGEGEDADEQETSKEQSKMKFAPQESQESQQSHQQFNQQQKPEQQQFHQHGLSNQNGQGRQSQQSLTLSDADSNRQQGSQGGSGVKVDAVPQQSQQVQVEKPKQQTVTFQAAPQNEKRSSSLMFKPMLQVKQEQNQTLNENVKQLKESIDNFKQENKMPAPPKKNSANNYNSHYQQFVVKKSFDSYYQPQISHDQTISEQSPQSPQQTPKHIASQAKSYVESLTNSLMHVGVDMRNIQIQQLYSRIPQSVATFLAADNQLFSKIYSNKTYSKTITKAITKIIQAPFNSSLVAQSLSTPHY